MQQDYTRVTRVPNVQIWIVELLWCVHISSYLEYKLSGWRYFEWDAWSAASPSWLRIRYVWACVTRLLHNLSSNKRQLFTRRPMQCCIWCVAWHISQLEQILRSSPVNSQAGRANKARVSNDQSGEGASRGARKQCFMILAMRSKAHGIMLETIAAGPPLWQAAMLNVTCWKTFCLAPKVRKIRSKLIANIWLADLLGDDLASAHHSKKLSGESQVVLHFEGQESRGPEEYFNILQPPHPTIRATCLVDAQ